MTGIQMKKAKGNRRFETFDAHFSGRLTTELHAFVREECLIHSRYLFVRRVHPKSTIQKGYCTHCKLEHVIRSTRLLKHNESWKCDKCSSLVTVKSAGLGRGKMIDRAYVTWYEKSESDPEAIVCTGYKVTRDYRESIDIETEFTPVMRCVFKKGTSTMALRDHYLTGYYADRVHYGDGWRFASKPYSLLGKHYFTYRSYQSVASIVESVSGTPFQYSGWNRYAKTDMDMVYFFSAFSKYPFIEYLIKTGMDSLADQIVNHQPIHGALNLRGKTMETILGLSRRELKDWKVSGIKMSSDNLRAYKWFRDSGVPISWQTASRCGGLVNGTYYLSFMDQVLQYMSLEQMIRYIEGQMRKFNKHFSTVTGVLTHWKDYINECKTLQMDLGEERFLFPNNLHAAHQKNILSIKLKDDAELDKKINSQQFKLGKYYFEHGEYFVRPITDLTELFNEGGELVHCVGRYADRYANGEIAILCVRKKESPDTPYYTMELNMSSLAVVQCRGLENCEMTDEIKLFVHQFTSRKLKTVRKHSGNVGSRIERQEAAV